MSTTISGYVPFNTLIQDTDNPVTITAAGVLPDGLLLGDISTPWSITNAGSILDSGLALLTVGTVTNVGSIVDSTFLGSRQAVKLAAGGSVTNASGGIISSVVLGIYSPSSLLTVVNAGSIASVGLGIYLGAGGNVTNQSGGAINSGGPAIYGEVGNTSVVNAGIILGDRSVDLVGGGNVINQSTGTISAIDDTLGAAVSGSNTPITVVNGGSIEAPFSKGVALAGGGSVTNLSGADISGYSAGIYGTTTPITVVNDGHVAAHQDVGRGVFLVGGGSVTNQGGGTISAGYQSKYNIYGAVRFGLAAIYGKSSPINVVNAGSIAGNSAIGVLLAAGGSVTNQNGGTITGDDAIHSKLAAVTVLNAGDLEAVGVGVFIGDGGSVTNQSSGTISGIYGIASAYPEVGFFNGTDGLTVVNAGSIIGSRYAVAFAPGYTNLLVVDPGAAFSGTVTGGNTIGSTVASTLELSGGGDGTLSGFGSQFVNFAQVTIDAGGVWSFDSADTLAAGVTLTDDGSLRVISGAVSDFGNATIADTAGGRADATVAGARAVWSGLPKLTVGAAGDGSLLISNAGTVQTNGNTSADPTQGLDVAQSASTTGEVTVTGSQSLLDNTGRFVVGDGGLGSLAIEAGGTVITAPGIVPGLAGAVIANGTGAAGSSVNVTGAGSSFQIAGALIVGNAASGSLNIAAGGAVTAASIDAAASTGGDGVIAVTGTGSSLTLTGSLTLGDQAAGELSILGGATVSVGSLTVGNANPASSGNVDVEGAGSILQVGTGGVLNVGYAGGGSGELTIGQGSTLLYSGVITENGRASVNNNGGVIDPDAIEYTTGANSGLGENDYSLYVGNIGQVQVTSGTGTWITPMMLTGTSVSDAQNNIDNIGDLGEWQLSNSGTLIVNANTVDSGQAFIFEDATDTLVIGQIVNGGSAGISGVAPTITAGAENLLAFGGFAGAIWGYASGDKVEFDNLIVNSDSIVNNNTLDLFGNGGTLLGSLTFLNKTGTGRLGSTAMAAAAAQIACFAAGTRIRTARGEVKVEELREGDVAITAIDGSEAPVVWIGHRDVDCARHPDPKSVWPVRIGAGAFGRGMPKRTLTLSPDHAVYVNEVLVPVKHLINGTTIRQVAVDRVTYYHVELDRHDVLYADGMPAESYLDVGDRANFANGGAVVRLHIDLAHHWEAGGCAPLVVWGPELEGVKEVVAARQPYNFAKSADRHFCSLGDRHAFRLVAASP